MLKELLKEGASAAQVELTDEQLDKFEKYYEYLIEKNKVMNLTAITDEREVVYKHFVDSIALIPKMDLEEKKIIDVGTGAGFPGIPLAIVLDNAEFVLMDSLNKRINFLNEVTKMCELKMYLQFMQERKNLAEMYNIEKSLIFVFRERSLICQHYLNIVFLLLKLAAFLFLINREI